eukprot:210149-Rhodomonas_salina.1
MQSRVSLSFQFLAASSWGRRCHSYRQCADCCVSVSDLFSAALPSTLTCPPPNKIHFSPLPPLSAAFRSAISHLVVAEACQYQTLHAGSECIGT